jgi:hypothetical protein
MAISKTGKLFLLLGGIVAAVLIVVVIAVIVAARAMGRPDVPDDSVLVLDISGELPDYVPEQPLAKAGWYKADAVVYRAFDTAQKGKGGQADRGRPV